MHRINKLMYIWASATKDKCKLPQIRWQTSINDKLANYSLGRQKLAAKLPPNHTSNINDKLATRTSF